MEKEEELGARKAGYATEDKQSFCCSLGRFLLLERKWNLMFDGYCAV